MFQFLYPYGLYDKNINNYWKLFKMEQFYNDIQKTKFFINIFAYNKILENYSKKWMSSKR